MGDSNFFIGERVRVRDKGDIDWRLGIITKIGPRPEAKIDEWEKAFAWDDIEKIHVANNANGEYTIGERVRVRDSGNTNEWRFGIVSKPGAKPQVKLDGWDEAYTWDKVERAKLGTNKKKVAFYPGSFGFGHKHDLIVKIAPNSQASMASVSVGWKIIQVNGKQVEASEIAKAIEKTKNAGKITNIVFKTGSLPNSPSSE